jgi:hypothetical protein
LWDPAHFASRLTQGQRSFAPPQLYHALFPARRLLLQDRLVKWLIDQGPDFRGDPEFVYALLLLAEEAFALHAVEDHFEIKWCPSGISIVEQGEPAVSLFLLLSGQADVIREGALGQRQFVARLLPGQFFGEQGIATRQPRNAHVIAAEPVTCLVLSPREPSLFEGRGADARLVSASLPGVFQEDVAGATTRIDCGDFLSNKLEALAAYRSQLPMRPDMLPEGIFRDLFGAEYFLRVLPAQELEREFALTGRAAPSWSS